MVELIVRLGVAVAFIALGFFGFVPFDLSWKVATALAGVSLFRWQLETKDVMNGGIAGFFAIAESFLLALFLANAGSLASLGFLVLIPCVYAAAQFSSPMTSMAPLAASCLVAADLLFSKQGSLSPQVLFHAAGVLVVSLILGLRRPSSAPLEIQEGEQTEERAPQLVEDGLLQLRENFRKLRDAYQDLERRSRRDKIAARIGIAMDLEGDKFFTELCEGIKELARAEEIAIYSLAQFEQVMVVRSVTQDFPGELRDHSIDVDVTKAPILIREHAERSLGALATGASVANVLLTHKGKMVGMICALEQHPVKLAEIRRNLTELAPVAAKAIDAEVERAARVRRVSELELLYEISSISTGASTPAILAGRVIREIKGSLNLDGIRVVLIEKGKEKVIANDGSKARLLDCMTFEEGVGSKGWVASGCHELVLFDVRQDRRCEREESLKRRIGSFFLTPLWVGAEVAGYICAATQLVGGIDMEQIATLRLIAAEMSRALERLAGPRPGGMMTPVEFSESTANRTGHLVYLEPLRREQTIAAYGFAAYEDSIRKLAHQVRAKLPAGSCLCRRNQGDFLVFLDTDEEFARKWANEVAASASFIAISTSDPTKRVPLALRAKVAQLTTQSDQLSVEIPA